MNAFARLESVCATAVERAFAVAFPSALEPVHVARKLVAAFEGGAAPAARAGRRFVVRMSPSDAERLASDLPYLERQWTTMLGRLAERSGIPQRPPEVRAEADAAIASGTVTIAVETLAEPLDLALAVRRGVPQGARLPLGRARVVVGRDPQCDLVLVDARASRRHFEIVPGVAGYRLQDLGSSNGTRVNGVATTETELGLGDAIAVGDSELVVEGAAP